MSAQPAAAPQAPQTGSAEVVDEVAEATPKDAGERNGRPDDKYKKEIDAILDAHEAKMARLAKAKGDSVRAQPQPEPEGLRPGESWDEIYKSQPPEVQRAMAEMRRAMTQKSQELAKERRVLETQRKALSDSGLLGQLAKESGAMPEEFDPLNPEHILLAIEAKVANRLKEVLEPLHKQSQQQDAVARFEAFKSEHPDLVSDPAIKNGVAELLKADQNISLVNAYWVVKGRVLAAKEAKMVEREAIRKRAAEHAVGLLEKGSNPGKPVVTKAQSKGLSGWEIYQRLKAAKK